MLINSPPPFRTRRRAIPTPLPPPANNVVSVVEENEHEYAWEFDGVPSAVLGVPAMYRISVGGVWYSPTSVHYVLPAFNLVAFKYLTIPDGDGEAYDVTDNDQITFTNGLPVAAGDGVPS